MTNDKAPMTGEIPIIHAWAAGRASCIHRWLLLAALVLCGRPLASPAQEVFREFTFNPGAPDSAQFTELDPGTKRQFSDKQKWAVNKPRHVPKPIVLDLAGATRAELSVEYWGGHIGTSGQRFNVNSNGWVDLPQPVGTPAEPQRFYRTLLGNNAVPIPLAHLRDGENVVQFAAGPQIAYGFDFGLFWIYDFTVRVFYGPERKAPAGEIVSPAPGAAFADTIEVEARAESPNGPITRVEFIGEYDDFDWDGDGVWREWQFTTHHGALRHHLGTATQAPWRVTFDAGWLPDQTQPVRVRSRITDATGMTTLTPPVEIVQRRVGRSVRMFRATLVPEKFSARNGVESPKCIVPVDADLVGATAARLVVSTWSGNVDDDSAHELRWNGERLAERFGVFHNYSHDLLELPVSRIKPGANEVTLFSTYKGHSLEVNWPGPVLLIEFRP
jgi:hypothetical protein